MTTRVYKGHPIMFLSRRKMYRKESKDISGLYMEGIFGQTPPVPETP
jgi:hypothetical protein